jgi:hypothetical protein
MTPPADSPTDPPDRAELAAQLDELEETLTELRGELPSEDRRDLPQPPRLSELLRFTEQYTIPTLIAILEATIKSLELLQRTLRLADPTRAAREESEAARGRLNEVGGEAGQQLAGALAELRTALSETDLPENAESRDLITDARDLTGEIEKRLREAEGTVSEQWDQERAERRGQRDDPTAGKNDPAANNGVMIDVSDDSEQPAGDSDDADNADNAPTVDVDAELESIKDELDEAEESIDDAGNGGVSEDSDEPGTEDDDNATDSES